MASDEASGRRSAAAARARRPGGPAARLIPGVLPARGGIRAGADLPFLLPVKGPANAGEREALRVPLRLPAGRDAPHRPARPAPRADPGAPGRGRS